MSWMQNVQVGQTVEVTADAFENQTFSGKVTNVSLGSSLFQRCDQLSGNSYHG